VTSRQLKYFSYLLIVLVSLLFACTPAPKLKSINAEDLQSWVKVSEEYFIENSIQSTAFSKQLQSFITPSKTNNSQKQTNIDLGSRAINNIQALSQSKAIPAKIDLMTTDLGLLMTHQMTFYGELFAVEQAQITQFDRLQAIVNSLDQVLRAYPVFSYGKTQVYAADDEYKLLAYQRSLNRTRAFIAFNHDFETHEMPLPFGFMASSKVKVWRSDQTEIVEFVTTGPLSIQAKTAVIVLIGG